MAGQSLGKDGKFQKAASKGSARKPQSKQGAGSKGHHEELLVSDENGMQVDGGVVQPEGLKAGNGDVMTNARSGVVADGVGKMARIDVVAVGKDCMQQGVGLAGDVDDGLRQMVDGVHAASAGLVNEHGVPGIAAELGRADGLDSSVGDINEGGGSKDVDSLDGLAARSEAIVDELVGKAGQTGGSRLANTEPQVDDKGDSGGLSDEAGGGEDAGEDELVTEMAANLGDGAGGGLVVPRQCDQGAGGNGAKVGIDKAEGAGVGGDGGKVAGAGQKNRGAGLVVDDGLAGEDASVELEGSHGDDGGVFPAIGGDNGSQARDAGVGGDGSVVMNGMGAACLGEEANMQLVKH